MHPLSLPNFDPIEIVRGAVASLSVTADVVLETNIGRIQEIFSRTELPSQSLKNALEDISALREAEHIGNGYWLPTPTRAVALNDDISLLVSIAPTKELQRHFSSVQRAGLGRLVATSQVNHLPNQTLQSWRGTGDVDTVAWTRTQIQSVKNDFSPSIPPPDLEVFSVKLANSQFHRPRREPTWFSITDRRIPAWNGVYLFRSRLTPNHFRYFLGKLTSSRGLLEGPVVPDPLSAQYGLASLLGEPLTISIRLQANSMFIRLPLAAPSSVRRLLSALCKAESKTFGYVWICHKAECWPIVRFALQNLGCEITDYE